MWGSDRTQKDEYLPLKKQQHPYRSKEADDLTDGFKKGATPSRFF